MVLNYSCESIVKNDFNTLEKVFAMSDFDIEIIISGCFNESEYYFTVNKEHDGYILKSNKTKKSHLISYAKMDSLKDLLKNK